MSLPSLVRATWFFRVTDLFLLLLVVQQYVFHSVSTDNIPPIYSKDIKEVYEYVNKKFANPTTHFSHSLKSWTVLGDNLKKQNPKTFSIVSVTVGHHSDGSWYVPSLHNPHSVGWNRTTGRGYLSRPLACNIRMFGVGLESVLEGFQEGGGGYMTLEYSEGKKTYYHGFHRNETFRVYCYYMTNKNFGSEFLDTPKTLGIAVYCPITLDHELGEYHHRAQLPPGYYCRILSDYSTKLSIHLRPTNYIIPRNLVDASTKSEIVSEMETFPLGGKDLEIKELAMEGFRPHAVCTVQTFRNEQSGPMLYMFAAYYQQMGWRVIIYDRFGWHREFLEMLLRLPGIDYHPYTLYQLAQPSKYNKEFADSQKSGFKFYYKMEGNWGYAGAKATDTADQDADKTRTYDFCRMEYAHVDMILYIDPDEIFFCPQASESIDSQKSHQHKLMSTFSSLGVEEMRFVRLPYAGLAPAKGFVNNVENRSNIDLTNHTSICMQNAYEKKSLVNLFQCWSSALSFDNFPKSADMASVCPFHYNHWSCDGMRNGGRDMGKNIPRCRCKVAFDMMNGFDYKPLPKKCHLFHFNNNKYRFQSRRQKHIYDKGDITQHNAIAQMFR